MTSAQASPGDGSAEWICAAARMSAGVGGCTLVRQCAANAARAELAGNVAEQMRPGLDHGARLRWVAGDAKAGAVAGRAGGKRPGDLHRVHSVTSSASRSRATSRSPPKALRERRAEARCSGMPSFHSSQ